jgi:zinc transport system substrate-binding protein
MALEASAQSPGTSTSTQKGKPVIAVSILPMQYFAQRVGGNRVQVLVLVGPGQSPHSYEPTPRQMATLGQAFAWFTTDIEFENSLVPKIRALFPAMRIVDTADGVPVRALEAHDDAADQSAAQGETSDSTANSRAGDGHNHADDAGRDPHIWLGKTGALRQAELIRDALAKADPEGAAVYGKNYEAFARDVESTFAALSKDLAPFRGKSVFVYHPAFGYFLDEFGIIQVAVETGGKEPTQKTLAALIANARAENAKVIFVQPQFSKTAAASIAKAIGGTVAEFDDLAADWLDNLNRMGAALKSAVRH